MIKSSRLLHLPSVATLLVAFASIPTSHHQGETRIPVAVANLAASRPLQNQVIGDCQGAPTQDLALYLATLPNAAFITSITPSFCCLEGY